MTIKEMEYRAGFKFLMASLIMILFMANMNAFAAEFHVRAREHFDTVSIDSDEQSFSDTVSGIVPTINFWFEVPYYWAIGLSWGLMFINNDDYQGVTGVSDNMELTKTGVEAKYWFSREGGLFTRLGISQNDLATQGSYGKLTSVGTYLGVGWEFKFEKWGLALEAARREISFDHDLKISTFSPSIGFHFYGYI